MKTNHTVIISALTLVMWLSASAVAQSTIEPSRCHAWAANLGWIDTRAGDGTYGAQVGEFTCSGFLYSANAGWINLGDGTPANGSRYSNTTGEDSGANHLGDGRLRGLAWSANLGWVNFDDAGNPRLDLCTGELSGCAWSANAGWITLTGLKITHLLPGVDADSDNIPDAWERQFTSTLLPLGSGDADGDGATDREEYAAGTHPLWAGSRLELTRIALQPGGASTSLEWASSPARLYRLWISTDLMTWLPAVQGMLCPSQGTVTSTVITLPPAADRRFFKVEALRPLAP